MASRYIFVFLLFASVNCSKVRIVNDDVLESIINILKIGKEVHLQSSRTRTNNNVAAVRAIRYGGLYLEYILNAVTGMKENRVVTKDKLILPRQTEVQKIVAHFYRVYRA